MKMMMMTLLATISFSSAYAETAYVRIVVPMTSDQCMEDNSSHLIFKFIMTEAARHKLFWESYFNPRSFGCDPSDDKPTLFAHGVFRGSREALRALEQDTPAFMGSKLEVHFIESFKVHYYLFADSEIAPIEDVFIRNLTDMRIEEQSFVKKVCNGNIPALLQALGDSDKKSDAIHAVQSSKNIILMGYRQIEAKLSDGTSVQMLPLYSDQFGNEWNCLSPLPQ